LGIEGAVEGAFPGSADLAYLRASSSSLYPEVSVGKNSFAMEAANLSPLLKVAVFMS
jgi:hypothetical protein